MRIAILAATIALTASAMARASDAPTTTAPDAASIAPAVGGLFDLNYTEQRQIRRQLESLPDLPAQLASLLKSDDPRVRRTSLILLRDDYGDGSVVAAVQSLLLQELSAGDGGDGDVIAACCEMLADWPSWDSIPALLEAVNANGKVAGPSLGPRTRQRGRVALWQQADLALRLISGEWPMPEPAAPGDPKSAPGSRADRQQQETLRKTWGDWWAATSTAADLLPQLRLELTWVAEPTGPADPYSLVAGSLWVRPTGSVHLCHLLGDGQIDQPNWQWDQRSRRDSDFHLNATQADAVRLVTSALLLNPSAGAWAVSRPTPGEWRGRLQVTNAFGQSVSVELAPPAAPGAIRPPAAVSDALGELVNMTIAH